MPRQKLLFFRSNTDRAKDWDEKAFVRLCLEGDRQAFEKIVEKYRDQVYWTAYNLVLDSEDARDVAQQAFIKIWKSLVEYDFQKSFGGWISRITVNCAIDFLRTRKETEPLVDEIEILPERFSMDRDLDIRKIFLHVAPLLSQRQRIVLVLREVYGMEVAEISVTLGCTESTVRNLLSQAKESFRKKVKEFFPDYGV